MLASSITAWRVLPARWQRRQHHRAILRELEAANTPKSLRTAWKKAAPKAPESIATRRLDAACYGQDVLNEQDFAAIKQEILQKWRKIAH